MSTYRIRIYSSFCNSANCKDVFERLCEVGMLDYYGRNNRVYITNEDDYTHVIIMNTAMPVIPAHIPKANVIGLAFEPPVYLRLTQQFVQYAINNIGRYFIGDRLGLPEPFVEHYGYMWHLTPLRSLPVKTNNMSIMVSNKMDQPGHHYRHEIARKILDSPLPIDIYGRGCSILNMYKSDSRLKGEFTEVEPYESYDFHICIENVQTSHYFSEKITNPLLTATVPVYLGCRNITEYFPSEVICLTGDINKDMELITEIIIDPVKYKRLISVEDIKSKISLLRNLDKIFT